MRKKGFFRPQRAFSLTLTRDKEWIVIWVDLCNDDPLPLSGTPIALALRLKVIEALHLNALLLMVMYQWTAQLQYVTPYLESSLTRTHTSL